MNRFATTVCLSAILMAGSTGMAQEQKPIVWSLLPAAKAKPVQPGQSVDVRAVAELAPGWHVFSVTQPAGGPVPTRFSVPPKQRFQLAGPVRQPTPKKMFDQNFGIETEFFEERVTFTFPVKVAPGTPAGKHKLVCEVEYQVCNDSLCMPPETLALETTVAVASATTAEKQ